MGIRPISVSLVNSTTENLAKFLGYYLQPIMKTLPVYIKDITEPASTGLIRVSHPCPMSQGILAPWQSITDPSTTQTQWFRLAWLPGTVHRFIASKAITVKLV